MKARLLRQARKDALRRLAAVHDAKHLPGLAELFRKYIVLQDALLPKRHAAEAVVFLRRLRAQLCDRAAWRIGVQQVTERRLRGCAQHKR